MPDDTPFFIVGSGRSGSTLLRLMLCGHSRIHIPPETWFIADLVRELPLSAPLVPAQVGRAVDIMTRNYRWPDMEIEAEEFRHCATSLIAPQLVDIVNLVYRHHLRRSGKRRFGDKTPRYIDIIPQIRKLYPKARFIHLIRDGRDVAISYIDLAWTRYYEPDFRWTMAMRQRRDYLHAPYADQILEVKYEDLVMSPELTLRRVCEFLREEFEVGLLNWNQLLTLVPERERSIHEKLSGPLRRETVGAWRRKLTGLECFAIESCLQRDLRRVGYELRFSSIAFRPFLVVGGWLLSALAPLLVRGIPYLQRRNRLPKTIYI